jgi:RNA polymerase sigma factor (sigma-70 family)
MTIGGGGILTESDAEIIEQARRGDPLAWEKLVIRHTKRIYNLCYRFVERGDQAEDLTQDVFIKVFRNLDNYKAATGSFVTWLISVSRNLLIDHYRQTRAERLTVSASAEEEEQGPGLLQNLVARTPSPEEEVGRAEEAALLKRCLNRLSPELREAVILRDIEELSYQEIGTVLGIPDGTVKSRINRGRIELARHLSKNKARSQGFST